MTEDNGINEASKRKELGDFITKYKWMIRPCSSYNNEYSECASIRGRFYQLFIDGETADCRQWKANYRDCNNFTDNDDLEAAKRVILSEDARRKIRLNNHFTNDVWEHRKEPPSNWDAPLPEWMTEYHVKSFLYEKQKAIEGNPDQARIDKNKWCRFM